MESDLIAGLRIFMEGDMLWIHTKDAQLPSAEWAQLPEGGSFYLPVPGLMDLGSGWLLRAEPFEGLQADRLREMEQDDPYRAWLDGERLVTPLQVRTRKTGDRIQPLGMEGHSMKVADLMVNVKLPRRLRDRYPLIVSGDQVAWLPGIHIAEPFRITDQTSKVVYLHLVRQNKG